MHNPLIICAAVTGGGPPGGKSPFQPTTRATITSAAVECWQAGAAMIHLHARRPDGTPTMDPKEYRALLADIRATGCDAILNVSAGDNNGQAGHDTRLEVAGIGAEVVSFDAGSFNTGDRLYNNGPEYLEALTSRLTSLNVLPEIEIFDTGHLYGVDRLVRLGKLPTPRMIQFVMGVPGGMMADCDHLPKLVDRIDPKTEWFVSVQGQSHAAYLEIMFDAFVRGGHVRTGIEDHRYIAPNEMAPSNAEMVSQWAITARTWGRPLATPLEAREILGISRFAGDSS